MKRLIFPILLLNVLLLQAQPFEKSYPYFNEAYGDLVFVHEHGYTLAGLGLSNGQYFLYLIHTDLNGDTLWTRHLDYGVKSLGLVRAVTDNEDNHYISFFYADSAGLVKFTTDWQEVWRKKFDDLPRIYQLCLDSENKLLLSASGESTCLMKLDNDGSLIWQSAPIGSNSRTNATAITETQSGNIALFTYSLGDFGYTFPNNRISIYSATGALIDSGNVSPDQVYSYGVFCSRQYEDHLLSVCNNGRGINYLVHHEENGTILQQKEITLPVTNPGIYCYIFNSAGGVTTVGTGDINKLFFHGMSISGDSLWTNIRSYSESNIPFSLALCADGGYLLSGGIEINGFNQPYLIKTDPWGGNSPLHTASQELSDDFLNVYPDPASEYVVFESTTIKNGHILILDIYGRSVAQISVSGKKAIWNIRGVKPGVYLYHLRSEQISNSGKLVIAR